MPSAIVLVETSSWIETLRERGDPEVRHRVTELVRSGAAIWCDMVRLELWHGARGAKEKKHLQAVESVVRSLPITSAVWNEAIRISVVARERGKTFPTPDLVIAATARVHGVRVDSCDRHFDDLLNIE